MPIRSEKGSCLFYRLSIRFVRDVVYPCTGIAIARFLSHPKARLIDCLADARGVLRLVIAVVCVGFVLS